MLLRFGRCPNQNPRGDGENDDDDDDDDDDGDDGIPLRVRESQFVQFFFESIGIGDSSSSCRGEFVKEPR